MKFEIDTTLSIQDDYEENRQDSNKYKMCYVDADTILHSAAIALQQNYLNVTHIESGRVKRFDNKTSFGIRGGKIIPFVPEKDSGLVIKGVAKSKWLGHTNYTRKLKGLVEFNLEDFEIEECVELKPEYSNFEDAMSYGLSSIGFTVGGIKKYADSDDYRLIISGGNGNYRNEYAKTLKYKGNRPDKPILYAELKEAMISQYKSKIILADGVEAEDICGWYAIEELKSKGYNFEDWSICISYVDKDVNMVYAPSINYSKFEEGFTLPTKLDCIKHLVVQTICGDKSCDNIMGLPNLTSEVTEKFGLRKANGCGKQTALNLLETAETEVEMWKRAAFAYQSYYGMEVTKFKAWDGEELTWSWLDYMRETAILVKMQEFEGQLYDVEDTLRSLGIDYTKPLYKAPTRTFILNQEVNESLQQVISTIVDEELKGYKSMKKDDLVGLLDSVKGKLAELDFEAFYEMKD